MIEPTHIERIIGWIGNATIVFAQWHVGNKKRWAFLISFIGELIWIGYAAALHFWSLAFICVVFGGLALRNYVKWGHDNKT